MAFGNAHPIEMNLFRQRNDLKHLAKSHSQRIRLTPRHLPFSSSDVGNLVQNLDADRAAILDNLLYPVGTLVVARCEIEEHIAVEECLSAIGHSPHPGRT